MKRKNKIEFLKEFNLFIKALKLNTSDIDNKSRKLIVRTLVNLWEINSKEKNKVLVEKLYWIKDKIVLSFEKSIKNSTWKAKITKEKVIVWDLTYERISIQWKHWWTSIHVPKQFKVKEETKKKAIKEDNLEKQEETKTVKEKVKTVTEEEEIKIEVVVKKIDNKKKEIKEIEKKDINTKEKYFWRKRETLTNEYLSYEKLEEIMNYLIELKKEKFI